MGSTPTASTNITGKAKVMMMVLVVLVVLVGVVIVLRLLFETHTYTSTQHGVGRTKSRWSRWFDGGMRPGPGGHG